MARKRINYREYITSARWLLKKHALISVYLSQGWDICCSICVEDHNLNVHHVDYKELGNEDLSQAKSEEGRGIWQLQFLCRDCHIKWHFDPKFKELVEREKDDWFDNFILNYQP